MKDTTITYTDAPVNYDGFGTRTIAIIGKTRRGTVRKVETPSEHVDWQRSRYESGMYLACGDDTLNRFTSGPVPVIQSL